MALYLEYMDVDESVLCYILQKKLDKDVKNATLCYYVAAYESFRFLPQSYVILRK